MYHDYFGFEQVPFSIAPDPDFLFLGPRHQEGLEHLRNGLLGSGGFLLLTGEVGTGKTTLSRAVLEELGEQVDVAFVLNPMLSERELLATICDQFGIPGRHEKASLKRLTDHLSRFLQEASAKGRNPVVLIDEAQHLLPSVLEQLRLLTNLETNSRKLLSVVLIGQPELQELLQRRELRQVAQRIVARYHLLPLTERETEAYIQHRLKCVGGRPDIFESAAIKRAFQFSQGTPRLINLVCDRALQMAARQETRKVTKAIVSAAAESLSFVPMSHTTTNPSSRTRKKFLLPAGGVIAVALLGLFVWLLWPASTPDEIQRARIAEQQARLEAQQQELEKSEIRDFRLRGLPAGAMLKMLADRWQVASYISGPRACEELESLNLACVRANFTLDQLVQLDFPALLETESPDLWLLLNGVVTQDNGMQYFEVVDIRGTHQLTASELRRFWSGRALVFWQLPDDQNFRQWLREGVQEYLPFSLRNASLEQQLSWLRASLGRTVTARMHEEDESYLTDVELAYLSAGFYASRPTLARPSPVFVPTTLTEEGALTARMETLVIPLQRRAIPSASGSTTSSTTTSMNAATAREEPHSNRLASSESTQTTQTEDEVPAHIRNLFDNAVAEVGIDDVLRPPQQQAVTQSLPFAKDLPRDQLRQLPRFSYDSHMYSGRTRDRWIRLNDRMLREGERMGELRVIAIEPSHTVFGFQDILFRLEALEDLNH
ncbi:AAA family ATPase [Aliidiomarina sanyensis]|uniref:AAA+ ATPase domain-containing protein n=1 Tax=Aliidiomarina sanyensis TaxID=1249555 RepID=A0A432WBK4_9GAMM|nr:AAA family ATPase [Aliidiomarina sanyensis]RUO29461.1 hypothetical protein CWE11_09945 [Aliidiomarina sanyensis]